MFLVLRGTTFIIISWNDLKFLHTSILVVLFQSTCSDILNYVHQQVSYLFDFILIHSNDTCYVFKYCKSLLRYISRHRGADLQKAKGQLPQTTETVTHASASTATDAGVPAKQTRMLPMVKTLTDGAYNYYYHISHFDSNNTHIL